MKILIFIVLVSVIGGLVLTMIAKPIRKTKSALVNQLNSSFEEEKETKDGTK